MFVSRACLERLEKIVIILSDLFQYVSLNFALGKQHQLPEGINMIHMESKMGFSVIFYPSGNWWYDLLVKCKG